eukprot:6187744-Pleurochrysis_carterae.AAC.3
MRVDFSSDAIGLFCAPPAVRNGRSYSLSAVLSSFAAQPAARCSARPHSLRSSSAQLPVRDGREQVQDALRCACAATTPIS